MTRVIAGTARGRRLAVPPGARTRPTSDRVREGLFSTLTALRGGLDGARMLDLFAGSGAVGLEAASRGAARVRLVESDARAAQVARENVQALSVVGVVEVTKAKVEHVLAAGPIAGEVPYDLVFVDPPYAVASAAIDAVLVALTAPARGWLAEGALVVVERSSRGAAPDWPANIERLPDRGYGETTLHYGRATGFW